MGRTFFDMTMLIQLLVVSWIYPWLFIYQPEHRSYPLLYMLCIYTLLIIKWSSFDWYCWFPFIVQKSWLRTFWFCPHFVAISPQIHRYIVEQCWKVSTMFILVQSLVIGRMPRLVRAQACTLKLESSSKWWQIYKASSCNIEFPLPVNSITIFLRRKRFCRTIWRSWQKAGDGGLCCRWWEAVGSCPCARWCGAPVKVWLRQHLRLEEGGRYCQAAWTLSWMAELDNPEIV